MTARMPPRLRLPWLGRDPGNGREAAFAPGHRLFQVGDFTLDLRRHPHRAVIAPWRPRLLLLGFAAGFGLAFARGAVRAEIAGAMPADASLYAMALALLCVVAGLLLLLEGRTVVEIGGGMLRVSQFSFVRPRGFSQPLAAFQGLFLAEIGGGRGWPWRRSRHVVALRHADPRLTVPLASSWHRGRAAALLAVYAAALGRPVLDGG